MLSRLTFPIEYLHPSRQWHRVIRPFRDCELFKQINLRDNIIIIITALIKWYPFIAIDSCCWPCPVQGPLKLWHDVWQILQEIPAGLFNFLWTATKVLSPHMIATSSWKVSYHGQSEELYAAPAHAPIRNNNICSNPIRNWAAYHYSDRPL